MGLEWLFLAHRRLNEENTNLRVENERLHSMVKQLDLQLQMVAQAPRKVMDEFQEFKDAVLTDLPFPDGKVPDSFWLSPEEETEARANQA